MSNSLQDATVGLNRAIERMTTGYKINSAKDDAAGYAVSTKMQTQLSSIQVCQNNVAMAQSMVETANSTYDIVMTHLQRMRDLVIEGQNGTYGADSIAALQAEYNARYDEVCRVMDSAEYNSIKLFDRNNNITRNMQIGITSDANSIISITFICSDADLLSPAEYPVIQTIKDISCTEALDVCIESVTSYQTDLGAVQNRLDSAAEALDIQYANLTSSLSTIKDADIATVSSEYIRQQILQQASASLLSTANQSPALALTLISGLQRV